MVTGVCSGCASLSDGDDGDEDDDDAWVVVVSLLEERSFKAKMFVVGRLKVLAVD